MNIFIIIRLGVLGYCSVACRVLRRLLAKVNRDQIEVFCFHFLLSLPPTKDFKLRRICSQLRASIICLTGRFGSNPHMLSYSALNTLNPIICAQVSVSFDKTQRRRILYILQAHSNKGIYCKTRCTGSDAVSSIGAMYLKG